jgi:hypothetical protein
VIVVGKSGGDGASVAPNSATCFVQTGWSPWRISK